jgi:DNA-binding transcriptional ArsR family regulator
VLRALSHPARRAIVTRLGRGPATVQELAEPFAVSLAAVSKHIRVLKKAGLVEQDRDGRRLWCRATSEPLLELEIWIEVTRIRIDLMHTRLDVHLAAGPTPS